MRCSCVAATLVFLVLPEYPSRSRADQAPVNRVPRDENLGGYQTSNVPEGLGASLPQIEGRNATWAEMPGLNEAKTRVQKRYAPWSPTIVWPIINRPSVGWRRPAWPKVLPPQVHTLHAPPFQPPMPYVPPPPVQTYRPFTVQRPVPKEYPPQMKGGCNHSRQTSISITDPPQIEEGNAVLSQPAIPNDAPPYIDEGAKALRQHDVAKEPQPQIDEANAVMVNSPQLEGRSLAINQEVNSRPDFSQEPEGSNSNTIDLIAAGMEKLLEAVEDIRGGN